VLPGTHIVTSNQTTNTVSTDTPSTITTNATVMSNRVYTYVPSVHVTLSNHLHPSLTTTSLTSQSVHSALLTATSSVYSMDNVLQQLSQLSVNANNSPVVVTAGGPDISDLYRKCNLHFDTIASANPSTRVQLQRATQRTGILHAPAICINRDVVLCNAVLQLRQLLPPQIELQVHAPLDEVRNAVRRAAMCLLEECKLRAVYKRIQYQTSQRKATNDASADTAKSTVVKASESREVLLMSRIMQAKIDSDRAMAHLFSIV